MRPGSIEILWEIILEVIWTELLAPTTHTCRELAMSAVLRPIFKHIRQSRYLLVNVSLALPNWASTMSLQPPFTFRTSFWNIERLLYREEICRRTCPSLVGWNESGQRSSEERLVRQPHLLFLGMQIWLSRQYIYILGNVVQAWIDPFMNAVTCRMIISVRRITLSFLRLIYLRLKLPALFQWPK